MVGNKQVLTIEAGGMHGYSKTHLQMTTSLFAYPWLDTSSMYSLAHTKEQTCIQYKVKSIQLLHSKFELLHS